MIDSPNHNELLARTCWSCAHTHDHATSATLRFQIPAYASVQPDGSLDVVRVCADECACERRQRANTIEAQRDEGLRRGDRVWQIDRWVEDPACELDPELAPIERTYDADYYAEA